LRPEDAWDDVETLFAWRPVPADLTLLARGRTVQTRFQLSWWDSLVVAAAQIEGCRLLLSEDLQDGAHYAGVDVRNPFRLSVAELEAAYPPAPRARAHRGRGRPRTRGSKQGESDTTPRLRRGRSRA
jgi:hypothetical protein